MSSEIDAKTAIRPRPLAVACILLASVLSAADAHEQTTTYPSLPFVSDYGGPFELTDHTGKQVTDKDFLGQYVILYFGYTDCADICPVTLYSVAMTLKKLGPLAEKITPLFVNLDHERKSYQNLEKYVHYFHPRFLGLSGTPEQLRVAASAYLIRYRNAVEADGTRIMVHSGMIFFLAPDGKMIAYFPHDAPVEWMATAMERHILDNLDSESSAEDDG